MEKSGNSYVKPKYEYSPVTLSVSSIPITPEMQSAVLREGQPMFQPGRNQYRLRISPEKFGEIVKDILRIAAKGSQVTIPKHIEINQEEYDQALQKWGEGNLKWNLMIKGTHRAARINGNQFASIIQLSARYMHG